MIGPWATFADFMDAAASFNLSAIAVAAGSGAVAGAISAGITGGSVLKGALFGGISGALFAAVGAPLGRALSAADMLGNPVVGNFIAQGFVGGLNSTIEGGNFGSGFLAGGVGSLAGSWSGGQFDPGHMLASAIVGGAASVLGGGKFLNGAITSAFAYAATVKYGDENEVTTGSPANPAAGKVNFATADTSQTYRTYDEAQAALKASIEAASDQSGWEYGGFALEKGSIFYLTQLGTSQNPLGISWDIASIKALASNYDILAYDHTHLQHIVVENIERGMNFSNGDVDLHNMLEGSSLYRGTFIDWHGSMFYLPGGTTYGHNMLGVQGVPCSNFPLCK